MRVSFVGLAGFAVFFFIYSYVKYSAAAPPKFDFGYAVNVATLVAMTGLAPFFLSLAAARAIPGAMPTRILASAVVGVALCVAAYALFFKLFIEGAVPRADLLDVSRRGIGWGALEGVLASLAASRGRPAV